MAASPASARAARRRTAKQGTGQNEWHPARLSVPEWGAGACRAARAVLSTGARPLKQGCREAAIKKDTLTPRPSRRTRLNRPLSAAEEGRTNVSSSEATETHPLQPPSVARSRTAARLMTSPGTSAQRQGGAGCPSPPGPVRPPAASDTGRNTEGRNQRESPKWRIPYRTSAPGPRKRASFSGNANGRTPGSARPRRRACSNNASRSRTAKGGIDENRVSRHLAVSEYSKDTSSHRAGPAERGASLRASPRLREAHTGKLRMAPMLNRRAALRRPPRVKPCSLSQDVRVLPQGNLPARKGPLP